MLESNPVPVVPLALQNLWGSFFSRVERQGDDAGRSGAACSAASASSPATRCRRRAVTPAALRERVAALLALLRPAPRYTGAVVKPGSARIAVAAAEPLVLGDHLGAEEQQRRRDLEAQQDDDRRRQRAVDDRSPATASRSTRRRTWRVISHSSAAVTPPISAWRQAQPPDRHHQVDRGQHEDLAGDAEQVEQQRRRRRAATSSRPNSSTLSLPTACRLPATSVTSSRPTPSERM